MVTVYMSAAIVCLLIALSAMMSSDEYTSGMLIPGIVAGLGLILTIVGYFRSKMLSQMLDTPTSLVRSVAVGNPELVGQVRPVAEGCLTVVVDGNQNMSVGNMVGYSWTYEQFSVEL